MSFKQALQMGLAGETMISCWLRHKGYIIAPAYEKIIDNHKGPALFLPNGQTLVSPDLDCKIRRNGITYAMYAEVKTKKVFSWRRMPPGPRWETGIDLRHYQDYLCVQEMTGLPVHLLFLHTVSEPWDGDKAYGCPAECPTGLFHGRLDQLAPKARKDSFMRGSRENQMVYWGECDLRRIASYEEVQAIAIRYGSTVA